MKKRILTAIVLAVTLALAATLAACSADPIVSFDSNGGSFAKPIVLDGSEQTLPTPAKTDYAFEGWYFDNTTFENPVTDLSLSNGAITENTTVFAKWKKSAFSLAFDPDGGEYLAPIKVDGSEQTLPTPAKTGFRFLGWYLDDLIFENPASDAIFTDGSIDADTTLFAKWERSAFVLSFDPNGGNYIAPLPVDGTANTLPVPVKSGHRFSGWFSDETFAHAVTDAIFTDGSIDADTTLFAKWEQTSFLMSFDADGGSECGPITIDGAAKTLPVPTKTDFEFLGWYYDDGVFSKPVREIDLLNGSVTENVTVYARWRQTTFTVTLSVDGNEDRTVKAGIGETIAEPQWNTAEGYAFEGWYLNAAMTEKYDFTSTATQDFRLFGTVMAESDPALFSVADAADYGLTGAVITGVAANAALPAKLVLPKRVGNKDVTVILYDAFQNQTGLTDLYIPDTVTVIAQGAFSGCTSLKRVRMSKAIAEVGDGAFYDTALFNDAPAGYFYVESVLADFKGAIPDDFEVEVREGTRVIADRVFWTSRRVIEVRLPASLVYVGFNAFLQNPISKYYVPDENENYAVRDGVLFSKDFSHLVYYPVGSTRTSWTVPDTVTSIGDEAFCNLYHLQSLVIPDSVKTIGDGVFDMSVTLREIEFGAGIERVGDGVLHSQNALARIVVKSPAPFAFGVYFLTNTGKNFEIYVADEYYDLYLANDQWKVAAARMKKLSEKQ